MNLGLIVEGHGDVSAVPVLLRNILYHKGIFDAKLIPPIRAGESKLLLNGTKFPNYVQSLIGNESVDSVLVTCDLEDMCPVEMKRAIIDRIMRNTHSLNKPIAFVAINREFESLFLSQIDVLRDKTGVVKIEDHEIPEVLARAETVRDAKGLFRSFMIDTSYKETRDQERFAANLDPALIGARHRAGRRVLSALEGLMSGKGDIDF